MADHSGSEIGPLCPPAVAFAFAKRTSPKLLKASVEHASEPVHSEGASTIHSAEERSMRLTRLLVLKRLELVRLRRCQGRLKSGPLLPVEN